MPSDQFFAIRSVAPASGYQGVWGYHCDDGISMERWPIDFVGVADVLKRQDGQWVNVDTQVVGIELVNGKFEVAPNIPCYYGIVRDSATHEECLDLLPRDLRSRVIQQAETSADSTYLVANLIESN